MKAFAAAVVLTVTTIITIGGAWICRGEFGIGPEWVLPILLAFVLPIQEKEQDDEHFKKDFVNSLKAAVIADGRSGVENVEYKSVDGREWIVIRYLGGFERRIHADANSNGMNMLEIAKEIYGNGASGRVIER